MVGIEQQGPGSDDQGPGIALVDHHCHGVLRRLPDRVTFESLINEGFDPPPAGTSHFDSPLGLAIRRWCSPLLDVEPFAGPDEYIGRRLALGDDEVNRRFLRAAGLEALLIDSGYRSDELLDLPEMASASGAPVREVVRLEAIAEAVAASGVDAARYPDAFRESLEERARGAVGLKSIVAYRAGFGFDPTSPSSGEVVDAAGAWFRDLGGDPAPRLTDPVLLRHGIWTGAEVGRERGLPLQFHSGWGDSDLTINQADPALLTGLIRALGALPVDVVFLHCWPYHRQAAYLAAVFPHVYFDVGSALNYTGPSAGRFMAEAMEIAPFTKQLFSTDAFGLPELYYLGGLLFRRAIRDVLDGWIATDQCSAADAEDIARLIGRDNAMRIYPVRPTPSPVTDLSTSRGAPPPAPRGAGRRRGRSPRAGQP